MQDGLAGDGHVAGRAEQFQMMFGQGHVFLVRLVTVEAAIVAARRLAGTCGLGFARSGPMHGGPLQGQPDVALALHQRFRPVFLARYRKASAAFISIAGVTSTMPGWLVVMPALAVTMPNG